MTRSDQSVLAIFSKQSSKKKFQILLKKRENCDNEMNLWLTFVTLGVAVSVFWAEEGEANYNRKQHFKTELTDKKNADTGKTERFFQKLERFRQRRSEWMASPAKFTERGYDGKKECPSGTVRCGNARSCISTSWICDGFDDCGDNWDEQNCCEEENNVPCGWSEWSEWTKCNTGCNAGLRKRSRTCLCQDGGCDGESTEWEECPDDGCFPEANSGCGTRVIKGGMHRIVGGEKAAKGAWPWQAQLFMTSGSFECGGTLVGPRHVISAAHCFHRYDPIYLDANNWRVHFGKQALNQSVGDGETISAVDKLILHEKYDAESNDNDIAMMILTEEQSPSNKINFACLDLDHEKQFDSSSDCFITGWGDTFSGSGEGSNELQEANVPIIDRDTCAQGDFYVDEITDNMMCAGFVAGGVDSCQGDSGGPLVCSAKDCDSDVERWYLVGVTSWGYGCALPNYPGVYADVSKYTSWIQNHIKSN